MASAYAVADLASLAGESSALSSNTKQTVSSEGGSGVRYNYRSYGTPALNQAIAKSLGATAEYLPDVNMVKMRVSWGYQWKNAPLRGLLGKERT